jgi:transcriptional regulator with XRE-family HTH domain
MQVSASAKEFKKLRLAKGYSQSQLARALGVTTMTVSRWETGLRKVSRLAFVALAGLPHQSKQKTRKEGRSHGKRKKGGK